MSWYSRVLHCTYKGYSNPLVVPFTPKFKKFILPWCSVQYGTVGVHGLSGLDGMHTVPNPFTPKFKKFILPWCSVQYGTVGMHGLSGLESYIITLSLQGSKSVFSQLPKEKCIHSEVIDNFKYCIIISHLSKLWKSKFFIVLCNIPGETAGEIWNWSLLGVKGWFEFIG